MNAPAHPEFPFGEGPRSRDATPWHRDRREALRALAEQLGLPIGHAVEVRLRDGVVLRGRLRLVEEPLFLDLVDTRNVDLAIGRATFRHSDLESCIRVDDTPAPGPGH